MRVAVSGATGFVGRHVIDALATETVDVTLIVRDSATVPDRLRRHRLVEMDVYDPPPNPLAALGHPDSLIHLAWGGLASYTEEHHVSVELPAHRAFLRSLVEAGLRRLVVSGTCLEYGLQAGKLHEGLEPRPVTPYGAAKNALRIELESLRATFDLDLVWARLFYLYGPGQSPTSLLPQLEAALARGEASFNMSGGAQVRDFLPVADAARHVVELALRAPDCGVVNVCSGEPVSVHEFVSRWLARRGATIRLNLGARPYADYEPFEFWGDRHRLDRCLEVAAHR